MHLYSTSKLRLIVNLRFTNNISVIITNLEYPKTHRLSYFLNRKVTEVDLIIILSTRSYLSAFAASLHGSMGVSVARYFIYKHIY